MSRIGKKPIIVPAGVTVKIEGDMILVKGPKGDLNLKKHPEVKIDQVDNQLQVSPMFPEHGDAKALQGLFRMLVANMVEGVVTHFVKKLEMVGIGYRATIQGQKLSLEVGFSHPVELQIPPTIACTVEKNTISISGPDKYLVGQTAAQIRAIKKPEPYKGKGIRYAGEVVRKKAGKAAKAAGAGGA